MMAAMPVVDPSAAMLKVVPGCCALNSSASCGTSLAPSVSEPLITSESARVQTVPRPRTNRARVSFFMLLDRNESNLRHDLLAARTDREIEKLLGQTGW